VIVVAVDIGGIFDHHYLKFLFIIHGRPFQKKGLLPVAENTWIPTCVNEYERLDNSCRDRTN